MFFQRIIDGLHISKTGTNVGLVELSGLFNPLFQFSFYRQQKIIRALFGILPYPRGDRNLGKGMRTVKKLLFDARNPSRKSVKKVLIVFADSKSTDDISAPSKALKDSGVEVFVIGYEKAATCSKKELARIASKKQSDHVILTDLFILDLKKIAARLVKSMCESKDAVKKQLSKKKKRKQTKKIKKKITKEQKKKLENKLKKKPKKESQKDKKKEEKKGKKNHSNKNRNKTTSKKGESSKPKSKVSEVRKTIPMRAAKQPKGNNQKCKKPQKSKKSTNITPLDLWLDFHICEKLKFPILANKVKGSNLKTN